MKSRLSNNYIAIDGNEANVKERVGSNTYAYQILRGLYHLDKTTNYHIYLKSPKLSDLPKPNSRWRYRTITPGKLWTQWRLPLDLYTHIPKPKLFFTPGHYAPRLSPVPSVISIMDLAFLHFPETYQPRVLQQLTNWTKYSALKAAHIFTISEHSKQDIVSHYGVSENKITVTYPGANTIAPITWNQSTRDKLISKYKLPQNFFIFIGTRQPRKNLLRLVQAIERLNQHKKDPIHLVITGKVWHQFAQQKQAISRYVTHTGYVPDADIPKLIKASTALIFPSLYEGFGIPVLEAMKLDTPVIASNVSSIPEITGSKHPYLFDPTNIDSIVATIKKFLAASPQNKQKTVQQGKIKSQQFTWEKCINQTKEVLSELAFS